MPTPLRRRRAAAFTLIEMLVVVTITVLLFFLLANVFGKARDRSRTAYCLNNLRQLGAGIHLYASDNDGYLPPLAVDGTFEADPSQWPGPPGYMFGKRAVWSDQIIIGQYVGSTNGDNSSPEYWDGNVKKRSALVCPADKYHVPDGQSLQVSYAMGPNFTWVAHKDDARQPNNNRDYKNLWKMSKSNAPSKEFVLTDGGNPSLFPGSYNEPYPLPGTADADFSDWGHFSPNGIRNWAKRHNGGGANVLFLDGHASFYQDLKIPYTQGDLKMPSVDQ